MRVNRRLENLLSISSQLQARVFLLWHTYFEPSYKIKLIVPTIPFDWFMLSFTSWLADRASVNPLIISRFINYSYF